ncbi:porin family protein [Aestuariibacter sp. AA17]|uniref:Porin family protein n=1 Tax=Fluctibacter corallii TaxID=2984329 RepID=A0ABT3A402_9ALTE|nr:porin family protein [Aestuariibacter sp. AA17]MCV2883391.1 porin family protein [Aestuariibacter sp. AA17]
MSKKPLCLPFMLLAWFTSSASAASPSWQHLEAGYARMSIDNTNIDLDGYVARGSIRLGDHFFVRGEVGQFSEDLPLDTLDIDTISVGLGFFSSLNQTTDLYTVANLERIDTQDSDENNDETGFSAYLGIRSRFNQYLEAYTEAGYINLDGADITGTGGNIGVNAYINDHFSIGVHYKKVSEYDQLGATLQLHF